MNLEKERFAHIGSLSLKRNGRRRVKLEYPIAYLHYAMYTSICKSLSMFKTSFVQNNEEIKTVLLDCLKTGTKQPETVPR